MNLQPALPRKDFQPVKLSKFDLWWNDLLPPSVKVLMPHWSVSAVALSALAVYYGDEVIVTMTALFWASMAFAFAFRKIKAISPWAEKNGLAIFTVYHAILFAFISKPVIAQTSTTGVSACNTSGLFGNIGTFVVNVFNSVTFNSVGSATLSSLICQVIGFLTLAILLGFLGVLGYVAFQIGYQRQPVSTTLDPLFGFLIFAGGSGVIIATMIGTGGITSVPGGEITAPDPDAVD